MLTVDSSTEAARMAHFHALGPQQQAEALQRLAASGMSVHGLARASGLSVEFIRTLLGEVAG